MSAQPINFRKIAEEMKANQKKVSTTSDVKKKSDLIDKVKMKAGTMQIFAIPKLIQFPFNPYDMSDPDYSKDNPFKVAASLTEFILGFCREEYKTNDKFKEAIDYRYNNIMEATKIEMELPSEIEVPEDIEAPLTKSEITAYSQFAAFPSANDYFRTFKGEKYSTLFKDPTEYVKGEDGIIRPQNKTVTYYLGKLEEAFYFKNQKRAQDEVANDPKLSSKTDQQKKDYIKSKSYDQMILSFVQEKAILPVFALGVDPATGTSLADKDIKKGEYKSLMGQLAYIQDKDFIASLAKELGGQNDTYADFLQVRIKVDAPEGTDPTKLTDTEKLEAYKQKTISGVGKTGISVLWPEAISFMSQYTSLAYYNQVKVDEPELSEDKIMSQYSTYFKKHARCMLAMRDEDMINRVTAARNTRDFQEKFTSKEIVEMSEIFKGLSMDMEALMASMKMSEEMDAEFAESVKSDEVKLLADPDDDGDAKAAVIDVEIEA